MNDPITQLRDWLASDRGVTRLRAALLTASAIELTWAWLAGLTAWGMIIVPTAIGSALWVSEALRSQKSQAGPRLKPAAVVLYMLGALLLLAWVSVDGHMSPTERPIVFRLIGSAAVLFVIWTFQLSWGIRRLDAETTGLFYSRLFLVSLICWSLIGGYLNSRNQLHPAVQLNALIVVVGLVLLALSTRSSIARRFSLLTLTLCAPAIAYAVFTKVGTAYFGVLPLAAMVSALWPRRQPYLPLIIATAFIGALIWRYSSLMSPLNYLLVVQIYAVMIAELCWRRLLPHDGKRDFELTEGRLPPGQRHRATLAALVAAVACALMWGLLMSTWAPSGLTAAMLMAPDANTQFWIQAGFVVTALTALLIWMSIQSRYEKQLRLDEKAAFRELRTVLDAVQADILLLDADTRCVLTNARLEEFPDFDVKQMEGACFRELPVWQIEGINEMFERTLAGESVPDKIVNGVGSRSAQKRRVNMQRLMFRNEPHVLIQNVEVTELIDKQAALERAQMERQQIGRLAHIAEAERDFNTNQIYFDAIAAEWLCFGDGTEPVTMPVSRYELLLHPDEQRRFRDFDEQMKHTDLDYVVQERHLVTPSGERFVNYHFRIERDDKGVPSRAKALMIDQTELRTALIQTQKAVAERNQFIADMNHELRTPLNAILGFGLLLGQAGLDERNSTHLQKLLDAANLLRRMVGEILDIQAFEQGTLKLRSAPFRLNDMVDNTLTSIRHRSAGKGLELRVHLPPAEQPQLFVGDPARISQILFSLLDNAVRHTDSGTIDLRVAVEAGTSRTLRRLSFSIADNDIGMDEDRLRALNAALRNGSTGNPHNQGLIGDGLTIASELLALMNGSIQFASEPGQGSTVHVELELPVQEAEPAAADDPENDASFQLPDLRGLLFISVDDSEIYQDTLRALIERAGAEVECFGNGAALIEWLHHSGRAPDLLMLDLKMDTMNGFETVIALRADPEHEKLPIVVISNYDSDDNVGRLARMGVSRFIRKPFDTVQLFETICETLSIPSPSTIAAAAPATAEEPRPDAPVEADERELAGLIDALNARQIESLSLYQNMRPALSSLVAPDALANLDEAIDKLRFNWAVEILRDIDSSKIAAKAPA